ncbi:MAG TPA: protease complex subunit PrcB family protein [Synergistaceae bacterium]|mgnify:CR=1 FL=1|nr:protease complex subunit PrcB family protein [Synergistaceae bacterium]HPJ25135.1 protease complex subunit PrcB family protein [Synergistaceae bacterium]HPQ36794.1 protease complex subunit PrcB family protein [Synergistaceae bacterium]
MLRYTEILLLTAVFLFGGSVFAHGETLPASDFQLLEEGFYAVRKEAGMVVAEGADAFQRLYEEDISPSKRPPVMVDFNRYVVVALFAGSHSSGGYRLEILSARYENKELDLRYHLHTPKPGGMVSQALTSPYAVILLGKN